MVQLLTFHTELLIMIFGHFAQLQNIRIDEDKFKEYVQSEVPVASLMMTTLCGNT